MIMTTRADNSTNFVPVFTYITKTCKERGIQDLSVIFFTDGQDTDNSKKALNDSLENMGE